MDILNDRDFAEIRQHLCCPISFKVLSLQHSEIRHSNFLGWLLSAIRNLVSMYERHFSQTRAQGLVSQLSVQGTCFRGIAREKQYRYTTRQQQSVGYFQ